MASEPEHRCVSENLGRLNDQSHRFPIRRLLSYRTTRHHASPPRIYIYPFATSFLFPRSLKTPFASNDNLVISFQSQTGVVVCIDFSPNLFFPFFSFSSSIDVKYNIKIVSTINRRKVEGGLEATENIIYPFHAAEQSSIVVTNVCKYDRARWLETIFSSLIESPIKLARRVFQNSRYKISLPSPFSQRVSTTQGHVSHVCIVRAACIRRRDTRERMYEDRIHSLRILPRRERIGFESRRRREGNR